MIDENEGQRLACVPEVGSLWRSRSNGDLYRVARVREQRRRGRGASVVVELDRFVRGAWVSGYGPTPMAEFRSYFAPESAR